MKRNLIRLSAILLVTVLMMLGLCSCTMGEDSAEAREICEDYFDAVIDNDFAAAYDIFDEIATREQVEEMWSYTKDALGKSKSYELKQEGWNSHTEKGVTLRQVSYELVSDDDKTMYVTIVLDEKGVYGFNVLDSTEFIKDTAYVRIIGVILTVSSFALFGVTIWMIVDVCKRKIKNKVLWILLIIIGVWFEVSVGIEAGHFDFDFGLFFGIKTATAYTINQLQAIGVRIAAPIGTIIYFFIRKSLSAREEAIAAREAAEAEARAAAVAEAKAKAEAEQAALEEAAVEAESAEEKTEENNEDQ
jgi:hypothetical protein